MDYKPFEYNDNATFIEANAKKAFRRTWLFYALLVISHLLLAIIAIVIIINVVPAETLEKYSSEFNIIANCVPFYFLAIPVCGLIMHLVPKKRPEKGSLGKKNYVILLLIGAFFSYAGSSVGTAVTNIISALTGETPSTAADAISGNFWVSLLFVGILAPIFEEYVFRKVIIDHTYAYGEGVAVLLSGLIFGLGHGNFQQIFFAAGLGFIFAIIYCRTRNLLMTIIPHMVINSCSVLLSYFAIPGVIDLIESFEKFSVTETLESFISNLPAILAFSLYAGFQIGAAVVGLVFFIKKIRTFRFKPSEFTVKKYDTYDGETVVPATLKDMKRPAFANYGFIVFIVVTVIMIINSVFPGSVSNLILRLFGLGN